MLVYVAAQAIAFIYLAGAVLMFRSVWPDMHSIEVEAWIDQRLVPTAGPFAGSETFRVLAPAMLSAVLAGLWPLTLWATWQR